jgi:serine/threonine protein phosphatase PrpC
LKGIACVSTGAVRVSVFGKSDLGRSREHNEDAFLVADLASDEVVPQPAVQHYAVGPRGALFMVADGMGGAAAGEVASAMATHLIFTHMATVWPTDPDPSGMRFAYRLREAVELANERIYHHAILHPEMQGMGTTVTAVGVFDRDLYLTQVGDSRAYLIRNGQAIQLTRDQSLMQRLVDAGEMTEEEAEQSERRNIILQALGPDPHIKVDLSRQSLRRRDTLLVCSDGLSGVIRKDELARLAAAYPDLPALCSALVDLANERGGPDNITVVAAHFDGDGLERPEPSAGVGYETFRLPEPPNTAEIPKPHDLEMNDSAPPFALASAAMPSHHTAKLTVWPPSLPPLPRRGLMVALLILAAVALALVLGL